MWLTHFNNLLQRVWKNKTFNLVAHIIKRTHTKSTKNHTKQKIYNQQIAIRTHPNSSKINCKTYHHNETIHQENRRKNHISNKGISLSLHAFLRESREKLLPNTQKNKFQPHQQPTQHIDLKKELKTKARQKKIYKEQLYISSYWPLCIFSKSITTARKKRHKINAYFLFISFTQEFQVQINQNKNQLN